MSQSKKNLFQVSIIDHDNSCKYYDVFKTKDDLFGLNEDELFSLIWKHTGLGVIHEELEYDSDRFEVVVYNLNDPIDLD